MKIGNAGWGWTPLPEDMPEGRSLEQIADRVKALGFDAIDYLGTPESLDSYFTDEVVLHLRDHLKEIGLEPNVFVYQQSAWNNPDPAVTEETLRGFEKAAATASKLGCNIVSTLVPLPFGAKGWHFNPSAPAQKQTYGMPDDYCYEKDWATLIGNYKKGLAIAKKYGLRMSIECFVGSMISTPHAMEKVIADVGDDAFGIQLDTNHLMAQHIDPEWTIRVVGGKHIFNVHCKDNDAVSRGNIPAGTGVIDYTAVINALKLVGYQGNLTVELEFTDNPARYNKQALEHIKLCLAGEY